MALESTLELPDEMEDSLEASGRLPDNNAVQMLWWKSHFSDILMLGKSNVHDNSLYFLGFCHVCGGWRARSISR
jgi:hypothetical protein